MAERSFTKEVRSLSLGEGEVFHGEGILAVAKALLQSGVSYVGGYQGAPVSHMMDVFADAGETLDSLGIHVERCANEAAACAMLAASIHYPVRGCAVWKSTVGTNVASDALSNLASAGVTGGALVVVGEDYGDGASIIQERSHAFAMKSQVWLLDPRPNLPSIVAAVERGFELSEASRTPVMLQLRIRACHVHGSFVARANRAPVWSRQRALAGPRFDYGRICLPPSTYTQEQEKVAERWPAAVRFIADSGLNEHFPAATKGWGAELGIILQGGLYNAVLRALGLLGLADPAGRARLPILSLGVTYPLVPAEIREFCAGKRAVLVVEEGQPNYLEEAIGSLLRGSGATTRVVGKGPFPAAGEYTGEVVLRGVEAFLREAGLPLPGADLEVDPEARPAPEPIRRIDAARRRAREVLAAPVPARPPGFCTGCPERPVFSALKLVEGEVGPLHVSADIGCHTFATLPPFHIGNTVLGYGLGLASTAAVSPHLGRRTVSVMGDGGFWHNGLTSGVANAVFNQSDDVLVVLNNGYTSATGGQRIPSSRPATAAAGRFPESAAKGGQSIEAALRGVGVRWVRRVPVWSVERMARTLKSALAGDRKGLKVIVAEGECQLMRQRRFRPWFKARRRQGKRVVRTRFGVDAALCTGDHSCIRLSGCPSLTVRDNPDPLRREPVAHVDNNCVGCGVCGEVAHAAALCPSFYRAELVHHPSRRERWLHALRSRVIGALAPA